MKKKVDLLGYADEQYIHEADPSRAMVRGRGRKRRKIALVAAAVLAVLLLTSLALLPFFKSDKEKPNTSGVPSDPVAGSATGEPSAPTSGALADSSKEDAPQPVYKDIYEKLLTLNRNNGVNYAPEQDPVGEGDGGYREVTDNQVAGVIEGDRIKRSDRHIYYLSDGSLYVYSIDGQSSKMVGVYPLPIKEGRKLNDSKTELFLSEDCKRVTVFMETYRNSAPTQVSVLVLDVSDPESITCLKELTVCGEYGSARLVDGSFMLVTNYLPDRERMSFEDPKTFVPYLQGHDENDLLFPGDIVAPAELTNGYYTVLTVFSEESLQVYDLRALLSFSSDVYVTADYVVAHRFFTKQVDKDASTGDLERRTELLCIAFDRENARLGDPQSIEVAGYLKDRYSLDIYDGSLRAVTTTIARSYEKTETGATHFPGNTQRISANLYCIDLASMTIKGQVIGFAPQGETVQSARFDGNSAYVCTAIAFTDPVFFFDLTDPENITYKETAEINGYSTSLVSFGDGFLLGIGLSGFDTLKVEIYKEGQSAVEPVYAFALERVWFSPKYKSYYIDRENGLLGLGYSFYEENTGKEIARYLVLHFDGEGIELLLDEQLPGHAYFKRGVYIDGYYYMLGQMSFKVLELDLEG